IDKLISFYKKIKLPISYKDFGVTMKEMEEIVLKRATQVNDMKAVPYEITLDMLKEAVENLEEYVNKIK
ncbi:MAG: glycerol dehydrogenase, partial [Fusobacterium mortiferum]|nr:glycerol dehydrogenase [Fusobacterium mortiferum]